MSFNLRKLGVAPLPVAAILALGFGVFGIGEELIYPSVLLEVILNVFLILAISVVVARISVKSFFSTGSLNVLLLGTAVLAFGTMAFLTTLSVLAIESILPASFGEPGSIIQRASAATTVLLFTISAILFSRVYLRSHNPILYWYSLALWATAVGFLSFFATKGNGDPLLWTGIASICVGSVYFLVSILVVPNLRSGRKPSGPVT